MRLDIWSLWSTWTKQICQQSMMLVSDSYMTLWLWAINSDAKITTFKTPRIWRELKWIFSGLIRVSRSGADTGTLVLPPAGVSAQGNMDVNSTNEVNKAGDRSAPEPPCDSPWWRQCYVSPSVWSWLMLRTENKDRGDEIRERTRFIWSYWCLCWWRRCLFSL